VDSPFLPLGGPFRCRQLEWQAGLVKCFFKAPVQNLIWGPKICKSNS
jgi:hypothetical protein